MRRLSVRSSLVRGPLTRRSHQCASAACHVVTHGLAHPCPSSRPYAYAWRLCEPAAAVHHALMTDRAASGRRTHQPGALYPSCRNDAVTSTGEDDRLPYDRVLDLDLDFGRDCYSPSPPASTSFATLLFVTALALIHPPPRSLGSPSRSSLPASLTAHILYCSQALAVPLPPGLLSRLCIV